jgi:hypothetical protein
MIQGILCEQWDYDLFKLNELTKGHPLAAIAQGIIRSHNLVERLGMDGEKLGRYPANITRAKRFTHRLKRIHALRWNA